MVKNLILYLCLVLGMVSQAQTSDPTVLKLFEDSYYTIKSMRTTEGIYRDALAIGVAEKPGSIAANGVGLISLCIADSMFKKSGNAIKWEADSRSLVLATLNKFISFHSAATNVNGLFRRYFDVANGLESGSWGSEYSTIDNAIFATGLNFCRNYYSNDIEILTKANSLYRSMDFTSAISADGLQMYMVLDENGTGNSVTGAYNEYMLVAWLAKNVAVTNAGYEKAQTYWNKFYGSPTTGANVRQNYWGFELISDGSFVSSFIPQFTYYYCHYYKNNSDYLQYFKNARQADSLWWTKANINIPSFEWGLGAGENPDGGYSANKIDGNSANIVSPHIIAGFLPIYPQSKSDLIALYDGGVGAAIYSHPLDVSVKNLWRYSKDNPAQRCQYIQAVDFSTMLYGLSSLPEFLGDNFFNIYNDLNADSLPNNIPKLKYWDKEIIYPNPAKEIIYFANNEAPSAYSILTINGLEVSCGFGYSVDIHNLTPGIYLVRIDYNVQMLIVTSR